MSRAKPYTREPKRDTESQWTHDMYEQSRTSLASRLQSSSAASASSSSSRPRAGAAGPGSGSGAKSAKLLDRLSGGKGKELIGPASSSPSSASKLFGFDDKPATATPPRELLPSKAARPTRASRPRGINDPGARNLVAASLGSVLGGRASVVRPISPASASATATATATAASSRSVSIMGAAALCVRVEFLAQGTTPEDVKSAFAPTPILAARLVSSARDRTATIEVDVPDRDAADELIAKFDGVVADGETLRLTIVRGGSSERNGGGGSGGGNGRGSGSGNGSGRDREGSGRRELTGTSSDRREAGRLGDRLVPRRNEPSSGKLYSDEVLRSDPRATTTVVGDKPLASRFSRRR